MISLYIGKKLRNIISVCSSSRTYSPVSADGSMSSLRSCPNLGWPASGAKPKIALSVVIKLAPIRSTAFNAYFLNADEQMFYSSFQLVEQGLKFHGLTYIMIYLSTVVREEQASTTTWTLKPCSIKSMVVWRMQACVSIPHRITVFTCKIENILVIENSVQLMNEYMDKSYVLQIGFQVICQFRDHHWKLELFKFVFRIFCNV